LKVFAMNQDRIQGMLLGVGIGDALGRCCEGMDFQSVKSTFGKIERYIVQNGWPEDRKLGVGTDDTSLTLVVAQGLLLSGGKPDMNAQVQAHVRAYEDSYGWGRTTWEVIRRLRYGVPWQAAGARNEGNGCPMKIAPTALLLHQDVPGTAGFIANLCGMTHRTSMAVSAGLAQAFALAYCLRSGPENFDPAEFVKVVVDASRKGRAYFPDTLTEDDITERLALCADYAEWPPERCAAEMENGRGYVFCSLPFSYLLFLRTSRSIESLYEVVSAGGDTDTNGSMLAALLGALNGPKIFPDHLVDELDAKDELVNAANRLCDLFKCRYLVIVQSPDCFARSDAIFVISEFLLTGWLSRVATVGPRIQLTGEVTAVVAGQLADALERLPRTFDDELYDALSGNCPGGMAAFCEFLRGGAFALVDGETTTPEELEED
jgi:ADP-ribosyl-[dinitrogen reductase] hydrolase